MARGYPDFFGYSVFPYYGDLLEQDPMVAAVLAGDTETIFSLTHKGVVLGGYLYIDDSINWLWINLRLTVDSSELISFSIESFLGINLISCPGVPINILALDMEAKGAILAFTPQISFSTEYKVEIINASVDDLVIGGGLIYTKIVT